MSVTAKDPNHPAGLRIAVSGAGGLVGAKLTAFLAGRDNEVRRLVRREPANAAEILFDPVGGRLETDKLEGIDAVVHLAGENVASGRWSERRKRRIRDSRVLGTRLIAKGLVTLKRPPSAMISVPI